MVLLKKRQTLDKFAKYDIRYPVAQRIKRLITRYYKIGETLGFSGVFTKKALQRLQNCPLVAMVTEDVEIEAFDYLTQYDAPVHLAQLSQEDHGEDLRTEYYYNDEGQGEGVNVYIGDTGLQVRNAEFEERAAMGKNFVMEPIEDLNGHGTHVAGIVGSKTYGVAKKVNLIGIKALDHRGHGSMSNILGAIEFAVNHRKRSNRQGVLNLSLGAATNDLINAVINSATETGLVIVVAAGNLNSDACKTLPASARLAITVGAVDEANCLAFFTNWGPCVDIFSSGVNIESVNIDGSSKPLSLSGTSMAAPVITGMAANLLSMGVHPSEVKGKILGMASRGTIPRSSMRGKANTPNLVAYNGCDVPELRNYFE